MEIFSAFGISVVSIIASLFVPHPLHAQTLFRASQRRIHQTVIQPSSSPSAKQFPSMSTMQRISITLTPIPSSKKTTFQQSIRSVTPIIPTPSPTPLATSEPTSSTPPPSSSQLSFFMNEINDYRKSFGLTSVSTNDTVCNFAKVRAQEISTNFSHDGFNQRVQSYTLPYTSYSLVTENIAETPNYQDVVTLWKKSPGHAENMRADTPYVCVENYGNYYAYEGLRD